jgi:chorismate synthase
MEYRTAGESHGRELIALVTGVPAGIALRSSDIRRDLARRQVGYGRGARQDIERDEASILSGVRFGATIGSPVALSIANRDWENWTDVMAVEGDRGGVARLTTPRPGHADLAGCQRTATGDVRDILERASARETAARVAAGSVARALLRMFGVGVASWVERIGEAHCGPLDDEAVNMESVESSDVRCPDPATASAMRAAIDEAKVAGESLGGVAAVRASGLVPGLGSYAERHRGLDASLARAVISIPAVKGVEFGDGFALASRPGSMAHDAIVSGPDGLSRASNHAGGLEGGMSNGAALVLRFAMKPIPTLQRPLATVDLATGQVADAAKERSDVCAVPAAAVVAEAEVAMVLADAYITMFGDTCVSDIVASIERYRERIGPS